MIFAVCKCRWERVVFYSEGGERPRIRLRPATQRDTSKCTAAAAAESSTLKLPWAFWNLPVHLPTYLPTYLPGWRRRKIPFRVQCQPASQPASPPTQSRIPHHDHDHPVHRIDPLLRDFNLRTRLPSPTHVRSSSKNVNSQKKLLKRRRSFTFFGRLLPRSSIRTDVALLLLLARRESV